MHNSSIVLKKNIKVEDQMALPKEVVLEPVQTTQDKDNSVNEEGLSLTHCREVVLKYIKESGSYCSWSNETWQAFKNYLDTQNPSGEQLMEGLDFKRRKDLENLFYKLSERVSKLYLISWENDYENGERSLPTLKVSKDGIRISSARLRRYGFDVPENSCCKIVKISNDEMKIEFYQ